MTIYSSLTFVIWCTSVLNQEPRGCQLICYLFCVIFSILAWFYNLMYLKKEPIRNIQWCRTAHVFCDPGRIYISRKYNLDGVVELAFKSCSWVYIDNESPASLHVAYACLLWNIYYIQWHYFFLFLFIFMHLWIYIFCWVASYWPIRLEQHKKGCDQKTPGNLQVITNYFQLMREFALAV